jgi:hypothetical protein
MLLVLEFAHLIPHADAEQWRPISSDQAASEFQSALAAPPSKDQQERLKRVKIAWTDPNWSPDIAMKSLYDIDAVYFGGYLTNKCRLK